MFNNIIEDYFQKWKIGKQKQKPINKLIQKNYKKDCESVIKIFLKMKEIMLTIKKIRQIKIEKEKRIHEKLLL